MISSPSRHGPMLPGPSETPHAAPALRQRSPKAEPPVDAKWTAMPPDTATAAPTVQPTLPQPVITTSHKRRYPQAPPLDFDTAEENRFLRAHDKHVSGRLRAVKLGRGDLLGVKRQGVLRALGQAQRSLGQARNVLLNEGNVKAEEVDGLLERIAAPLEERDEALARHGDAEFELIKATQAGGAQHVIFAQQAVDEAQGELADAEAALAQATPPWAQVGAAHTHLLEAARCQSALQLHAQNLAKNMRVQWLQLDGQAYTKLPHFAAGAFGKVALAMRRDGTLRALKTLRTVPSEKPDATQMTRTQDAQREVALMQRYYDSSVRLHHDPHTQKLIMDMPLALGSLDSLTTTLHVPLVRSTARQLFARLAEMHADGVVHNDLKPENINVHADGSVVPADFGLAGFMPGGSAIGTPAYAAPEHCVGHDGPSPGLATDVWAAGLSLATAHLPLRDSPFAIEGFKGMQQVHDGFESWRSDLVSNAQGDLAQALAQETTNPFHAFFAQLRQIDAPLCDYLLTHVLVPASQRVAAGEAHRFFASLQPSDDPQEAQLAQQLEQRAKTPYRSAAKVALQSRFEIEENAARAAAAR